MTRKDYVQFAAMLRRHSDQSPVGKGATRLLNHSAVRALASDMADIFAADNSLFDRARFLTACGVQS